MPRVKVYRSGLGRDANLLLERIARSPRRRVRLLKKLLGESDCRRLGIITIPKGSVIVKLIFQGGTCTGMPDGQGGNVTLTSPSNNAFYYDPTCEQTVASADLVLTFGGSTMYFVEIQNKDGF